MGRAPSKKRRASKGSRRGSSPPKAKQAAAKRAGKIEARGAAKPGRRSDAAPAAAKAEIAKLSRELSEARQRQAAMAEILNVIASSPDDVKPVFDAIVRTVVRLVQCDRAFIMRCDADSYYLVATAARDGSFVALANSVRIDPAVNFPSRAIVSKKTVYYPDWSLTDLPEHERRVRDRYGMNCSVYLPMLRKGECIGLFALASRQANSFDESSIALAESFCDQALIAIENARLFNETKEALQRQTATSEILRVIASSPSDVQPVFDAIAQSACRVIGGHSSIVTRVVGDQLHLAAFTTATETARELLARAYPQPLSSPSPFISPRVARTGQIVVYADTEKEAEETSRELARARGYRSLLSVPMLRDGTAIGTINVTRVEPGGFGENTIALMKTFADQAVIAIENTRLFNETNEALERQTATADILKVIASSPDDVQPVFQAIADRSNRLVDALSTTVFTLVDGVMDLRAFTPTTPEADATLQALFPAPLSNFSWGESIGKGKMYRVIDAEREPQHLRDLARKRGWRSCLCIPLLRDGKPIGMIGPTRAEPGPFTDHHVQLMQTFADQAVIAISNVELFQQVQNRTRELSEALQFQTATSDVLKVISRSPDQLQPVLDAIVETSRELCGSDASTIFLLREDGMFHFAAMVGTAPKHLEDIRTSPMKVDAHGSLFGRLLKQKRTLHYANVMDDPELSQGRTGIGGPRALLVAPLMNKGEVIGAIVLRQSHEKPFTARQIQAIEVFADQAVIAISNVGLFEQVQARTSELTKSLDDLRAAQDRLVQTEKLASLGQLTAGIAHEIKNPLNFVNNFSALSAELVDELDATLAPVTLEERTRGDVGELTSMLKSNLDKVVQHGKRADSIVKNMLLHSREGTGERRSVDINALVEESLNLAYHGARAERSDFQITLKRDLDPSAGTIELYPQEITRALLNMISNGFYAATRREGEAGDGFEPTLQAATRGLLDRVEIRIRDNGTGISADVRDKMFNPFFTTKPAGEGTGLGLSMSHDIIVKQHGGAIDVETEPGRFTEFIIVLPRTINFASKIKGPV